MSIEISVFAPSLGWLCFPKAVQSFEGDPKGKKTPVPYGTPYPEARNECTPLAKLPLTNGLSHQPAGCESPLA